jgi:ATPase subunit of ABC transporter with duplicated ATPase domains
MSKRSDRRKKRKEARAEKRRIRRENRANKKQARRDSRAKRKADRRQARLDRIDRRQTGKSNRTGDRQDTKRTAYEMGFDPNAWVGDVSKGVSDVVKNVAGAVSGGGYQKPKGQNGANISGGVNASGDQTTLMIMGAGAVALMLFLKK